MSANEEIIIRAILAGTREYIANAQGVTGANEEIAASTDLTSRAMERAGKRSYLMNQALFTARRLMYGVTLATIASGIAAAKWGFDFNSAMQQARVALSPLQSATFDVNRELDYLFNFTKYTPFQFKDVTVAFRQMYGAMAPLGLSAQDINGYLKAIIDALSFVGKTSPGALNRVAVALQHVAFQGRLTGQGVTQLARDGLPVYAALHKELGLTADQMHQVGKLNIPVNVALKALHDYIESTPGFMNAAHRQAVNTFHGLFTTFRDNTSQIMGYVEKGLFTHAQQRLVDLNGWFTRVSKVAHDSGGNVQAIMLAIGGPGAVLMWNRVADVLHQFWILFVNVSSAIGRSQVFWAAVYLVLTLISGVLHVLNPLLHVFGGALVGLLIPALITWYTVTKIAAFWQGVLTLEEALAFKATKDLSFGQFLLAVATGRYAIMARLAAASTVVFAFAQAALAAATEYATVSFIALGIALELNPIILIITAVLALTVGLVILYFKWKAFHDLVNNTFHWLVSQSPFVSAAITLAFGPLGIALETLILIVKYWDALKSAWHFLFGGGSTASTTGRVNHTTGAALALRGGARPIPHLADGGSIISSGAAWVGERGPELLSLPVGASIIPQGQSFGQGMLAGGGVRERIPIKVMIGRKVLVDIVAEEVSSQMARA